MDTDIPQRWVEQGLYDLETGRAMLESGRYLYVPFCCQQAVEKVLKAVIAKSSSQMPPRIHNLMQLAERANIALDEEQLLLARELTEYYIQSRYPDEMGPLGSAVWRDIAGDLLGRTEELVQWLSSMIKS